MRICCKAPQFMYAKSGFIGIHFPADFTAEHEWGIKELKQSFGIPELKVNQPPFDIKRVKSTIVPETLLYQERHDPKQTGLVVLKYSFELEGKNIFKMRELDRGMYSVRERNVPPEDHEYQVYDDIEASGAWSGGDFGIVANGNKARKCIQKLQRAIGDRNICLFLGGGGGFENAGLNVIIADKIPKSQLEIMQEGFENAAKLHDAAHSTGIYDLISKDQYFSLSPRWKGDRETDYPTIFWLNPRNQDDNNYGWFTVEELKLWMEGKGPIPKTEDTD